MPDGDFDAQYAEVADEPRRSMIFEDFASGGTFDEKLADLCQDIVEVYEDSRPSVTPRGTPDESPGGTLEDPEGGPFLRASYAEEIRTLALEEFPIFFDAATIDRFSEISGTLMSIASAIRTANDDNHFAHLQSLMTHWKGTAASNFGSYLDDLGTAIDAQRAFVGDTGAAAAHFEELMKRMRVDAYGLAKNLMLKVDPPPSDDGMAILSTVLVVGGLIAAGVLTFGAGALVGAVGVATFSEFALATVGGVVQIQQNLKGGDEEGDREIYGKWEPEYIPSCRERIEEIVTTGQNKADLVMDSLHADMAHPDFQQVFLSRPEIVGMRQYDEGKMTLTHGFEVSNVAELRRAGDVTLPVMAQYFEEARASAGELAGLFSDAVGQSVVASTKAPIFAQAASALEESFTHLRDDLYKSGLALTAIADDYAQLEEQHEAMMDYFQELMNDKGMKDYREGEYKPHAR